MEENTFQKNDKNKDNLDQNQENNLNIINENYNDKQDINSLTKITSNFSSKGNEDSKINLNNKNKILNKNLDEEKKENSRYINNNIIVKQDNHIYSIKNNIKTEKKSYIKFIMNEKKDSENEKNNNDNLFYLGNLFHDLLNEYNTENKNYEQRLFLNKTFSQLKISIENNIKENETFNFDKLINSQLNEIRQKTLSYLDKAKLELDKKYSIYIQKINEYIFENEKKLSKIFTKFETNENFTNYADNKIFKQVNNILEIHENIISSLEEHVNILFSFLDEYNLIQQKNPLEKFLNKNSREILDCWFLSKINFDKLSISNIITNKNLSELVIRYLSKKKENNFAKITIQKDTKDILSFNTEFLRDNITQLKQLKICGLPDDIVKTMLIQLNTKKEKISEFLNEDNSIDYSNDNETPVGIGKRLESLSINELNIISNNEIPLPKINLPVLKKVKLKKCKLPLDYFFDSIVGQTSFLRIINIQKCKLTDNDFYTFFEHLSKKAYLQDSLQYLDFSDNNLSYINLERFIFKGGKLKNLKYFDLNKNNIYGFVSNNLKALPALQVLDLTNNNISNFSLFEEIFSSLNKKTSIVLMCNNIFISNNKENNKKYRKYLSDNLPFFKYQIKKLNFSLLYNKENNDELNILRISPFLKISIIKLNLSHCGLNTEIVWKLFQNNYGLFNLVSLNLSCNFITNNYFILCGGKDIFLEKLTTIDLSMNQINCNNLGNLEQIEKFIINYQKLKKIKIQENGFMNDLYLLYQQKKEKIEKMIDSLNKKEFKFDVDTIHYAIINEKLKSIINLKDKKTT